MNSSAVSIGKTIFAASFLLHTYVSRILFYISRAVHAVDVYTDMATTGTRTPIAPVILPDNEVLMEDMALYAEKIDLQGMMQEYLRRCVQPHVP